MKGLQFITAETEHYSYVEGAYLALQGGCRWIQLRMKEASCEELLAVGRVVRGLCTRYSATFIIDDHVDLVEELGADGVHLGLKDMPIVEARRILGPKAIIGGTANTFEDVLLHYKSGANYIGYGPYRFTTTKKNLAPTLGLEGYQKLFEQMREADIHLPVVAIGGIENEDIPALMRAGASGIAISGTILQADNPEEMTEELINIIQAQ